MEPTPVAQLSGLAPDRHDAAKINQIKARAALPPYISSGWEVNTSWGYPFSYICVVHLACMLMVDALKRKHGWLGTLAQKLRTAYMRLN